MTSKVFISDLKELSLNSELTLVHNYFNGTFCLKLKRRFYLLKKYSKPYKKGCRLNYVTPNNRDKLYLNACYEFFYFLTRVHTSFHYVFKLWVYESDIKFNKSFAFLIDHNSVRSVFDSTDIEYLKVFNIVRNLFSHSDLTLLFIALSDDDVSYLGDLIDALSDIENQIKFQYISKENCTLAINNIVKK